MARCGCAGGAGTATCAAIVRCVAQNLGPGLSFDPVTGRIRVRISRDAGNIVSIGSDGGVYGAGGTIPPDTGGATVEGLPDPWFSGINGGGNYLGPHASPQLRDLALANALDMVNLAVGVGADNVSMTSIASPTSLVDDRAVQAPGSVLRWHHMSSTEWGSVTIDPGYLANPTSRDSRAPDQYLEPDGGWYGQYRPHYTLESTREYLHRIAARCVVNVVPGLFEVPGDPDYNARNYNAALDAVVQARAQRWVVVSLGWDDRDAAQAFVDADIAVNIGGIIGNPDATPQGVLASGATFATLVSPDRRTAEGDVDTWERITEFANAGVVVIGATTDRQDDVRELINRGATGILGNDPIYARGARGDAAALGYRDDEVRYVTSRMAEPGMCTRQTDSSWDADDIGFPLHDQVGWFFYAGYSDVFEWVPSAGESTTRRHYRMGQLLGRLCPLEQTTNYTLTVGGKVLEAEIPQGDRPSIGAIVASTTDVDCSYRMEDGPAGSNGRGYWCKFGVGSADSGLLQIVKLNPDGTETPLASTQGTIVNPGATVNLAVTIDATSVTFEQLIDDAVVATATAQDGDWRGPYCFFAWDEPSQEEAVNEVAMGITTANVTYM